MRTERHWPILWVPLLLLLLSCTNSARIQDLINDPFPEAQAELSKVVDAIADDAMAATSRGSRHFT